MRTIFLTLSLMLFSSTAFAMGHLPKDRKPCRKPPQTSAVSVPELDASASGSALALIIGAALIMTARRKRLLDK